MQLVILPIDQKLWLSEAEVAAAMSLTEKELQTLRDELDFPRFIRVKRRRKYLREEVEKYARAKFGVSSENNKARKFFGNEN